MMHTQHTQKTQKMHGQCEKEESAELAPLQRRRVSPAQHTSSSTGSARPCACSRPQPRTHEHRAFSEMRVPVVAADACVTTMQSERAMVTRSFGHVACVGLSCLGRHWLKLAPNRMCSSQSEASIKIR